MKSVALALLVASSVACVSDAQESVRKIAELSHEPLREVSGIVRSSTPGVFWVHNDSGDSARIFAVTLDGKPVIPPFLKERFADEVWPGISILDAWNVDWEDIALAEGNLYIGDVGNNGNGRRDLGVYVLAEPNPTAVDRARALRFLPVRYPDQQGYPGEKWHFDCEALFVADGKLHFLTKHRKRGMILGWEPGTKLYRLDSENTDAANELTLLGTRSDIALPTAADLSPDGDHLAVLTYGSIWIFDRPAAGDDWLAGNARRLPFNSGRMGINEAVTWKDERTLIVANEQREVFEVDVAALTPVPGELDSLADR